MIEPFSEWLIGLIKEDKDLGLVDVKRSTQELHEMYRRYREYNINKKN